MTMDVKANARYLPVSAQKMRLVCDQVRGMDAEEAVTTLKFMPQKAAELLGKIISSALSNAENNFELSPQDFYIAEIFANEGPRQMRFKAGARGRYKPRVKQSAHVSVILREYEN
jgi:large subunit ribosomal protein L22